MDVLASLERLSRLRDSGALTDEEFRAEKAKILASLGTSDAQQVFGTPQNDGLAGRHTKRWIGTRRGKAVVAAVAFLLLVGAGSWWWFSPYLTLRNMQAALAARDADAFAKYVDFASLRNDLKADAFAEIAKDARTSKNTETDGFAVLGAAMVGPLIDGMISPNGLRAIFAMKDPDGRDFGLMRATASGAELNRTGLSEFRVKANGGDTLVFSLHGLGWRLSGIDSAPHTPTRVTTGTEPVPRESLVPADTPPTVLQERSGSADLTGTWVNVDEECGAARDTITFSSDGQYNTAWTDGSWSIKAGVLLLRQSAATAEVPFSISNDELLLNYDDGPITYRRCG